METYGLIVAATVGAAFLLYALLLKKMRQPVRTVLPAVLLSAVLGLILAKAGYVILLELEDILVWGEWDILLDFQPRRLCFVMGAAGVCLGVWLAGRGTKCRPGIRMDVFAAPGALLVAGFRLAESQLGKLGGGSLVEGNGFFLNAPFTLTDQWGDRYISVWFWEMLAAALIFCFALWMKENRPGLRFQKTVFALCLCQLLLENMRNQSMRWGFVYVEQVLCAVILMTLTVLACRRRGNRRGRYLPCLYLALCMGGVVGEEFARQKGSSRFLADAGYWLLAAILAVMAVIYFRTVSPAEADRASRSGRS